MRGITEPGDVRNDLGTNALHEAEALVADRGHLRASDALAFQLLAACSDTTRKDVGVQAAAQTLVRRDHDQAHAS